jgi:hypothetical protein
MVTLEKNNGSMVEYENGFGSTTLSWKDRAPLLFSIFTRWSTGNVERKPMQNTWKH